MKRVPVTFDGVVISTAEVDESNGTCEFELEPSDFKRIIPDWDETDLLSIGMKDTTIVDVLSAYPDWDVDMMDKWVRNGPKGTFDA